MDGEDGAVMEASQLWRLHLWLTLWHARRVWLVKAINCIDGCQRQRDACGYNNRSWKSSNPWHPIVVCNLKQRLVSFCLFLFLCFFFLFSYSGMKTLVQIRTGEVEFAQNCAWNIFAFHPGPHDDLLRWCIHFRPTCLGGDLWLPQQRYASLREHVTCDVKSVKLTDQCYTVTCTMVEICVSLTVSYCPILRAVPEIILGGATFLVSDPSTPRTNMESEPPDPQDT